MEGRNWSFLLPAGPPFYHCRAWICPARSGGWPARNRALVPVTWGHRGGSKIPWPKFHVYPGRIQRRQNAGVSTTSRVKISRRPSSIANVQTQVWKSPSTAKVVEGPTSPSPGPVLLMLATMAVKAVMTSRPEKTRVKVRLTMLTMYMKPKASTANRTLWGATCPPMRTLYTALGCMARMISR